MRRLLARLVVASGLWACLGPVFGTAPFAAEPLPPAVAAVVDYQKILQEAKAARSVRDQIEARRERYQEQIAKEEQRLNKADKDLAAQRGVLSPEAYADRRTAFEKDVAEVQRLVQERRRQLDAVSAVALGSIRDAIVSVVEDLSDRRGFNLVLPSSGVLLFAPAIDLTGAVLDGLNAKLPDVRVPEKAPE
ncbi:MAG: OmpH family outer membrane protein [Geminicoccaceae bacterium]|nr:OmpH family outer membrane protein [Geminicoccaceae bacterium]